MQSSLTRSLALLLLGLVWLGQAVEAPAQQMDQPNNMFRSPPPQTGNLPASRTQAVIQSTAPATPGYMASIAQTPYSPYSPYGGYYTDYGPVGGFLMGSASVINAQGQFAINQQQAVLVREDIKSRRIDNRQKAMEQYLWIREHMPTLQDDRERDQAMELRRAKTQPPLPEIWSGKSLNDLMAEIVKLENSNGVRGPSVPLDEAILAHINLSSGATQGSLSMIRDGRLAWTGLLRRPAFSQDRERIDQLTGELFRQAGAGALDSGTMDAIIESTNRLRTQLKSSVAELPSDEYIESVRYVNQLQETWKTLQRPDGAKMLGAKSAVKGNSVGDLVEQMGREGVRFGPAASGDEAAYNALYQALLSYDAGLTRLVAR